MIIVYLLIVVGIENIIDLMSLYHCFETCYGKNNPGICLAGIHDNGTVEMTEGIARLKVIKTEEGPDLSAVSYRRTILIKLY